MKKEMLINVLQPEECRIAIVEDGVLEELYLERTSLESYTGNIYKGKIVNLEPAIQAAFVDFSVGRNGFLHVSDVEPQYYDRHRDDEPSPRDRDRDPRRRPRTDDREGGGPPPARDRDRPDRSERGRRDRSGVRRFGEGLLGEEDLASPPPPAAPVIEPEVPAFERPEPRRARAEPPAPSAWSDEPPFARDREAEPRPVAEFEPPPSRTSRTAEPFDPDLPPSRTHRGRSQPTSPKPPVVSEREEASGARFEPLAPAEPETDREPRRGRGRGRAAKPVETAPSFPAEPEDLLEPAPPEPFDTGDEARDDPPRRRGGRSAIRSRGGDREPLPERPRERARPAPASASAEPAAEIERPRPPERERGRPRGVEPVAERERSRGVEPVVERERPRGVEPVVERERPRGVEPDPARERERSRMHDRAGEPGYVPRRERSRAVEPPFGPDQVEWVELGPEIETDLPAQGEGEGLAAREGGRPDGPRRRRRRRGRRRDRPETENAGGPAADEFDDDLDDDVETPVPVSTLPPQARAPSVPRHAPRPPVEDEPLVHEFDFGDDEADEFEDDEPDDLRDPDDADRAVGLAEDDEIDPGLEEEIRREIEEIAELEREMGLRGPAEARPRRGDEPEPGGRPSRGRGPAKPPLQEIFRRGDEVLVQVIKESIGTKGPTLSTYISIPGRYLVLMPGLNRVGVSRKIADESQRRKLRDIMNDLKPPKGLGFIVRTAGLERTKRELARDLAYLLRLWKVILRRIKQAKTPAPIYQESDMITRTIRDIFTGEIDTIWIDEPAAFERAKEFLQVVMPKFVNRLKLYEERVPLFHKYGIEDEIAKIQRRHVPLPQGGSIVIDQTEALVAIDVNSGNFRVENDAERTAYEMNLRAAKEIARQLRLRDLGGVIVNDFIDMREERHRRGVEKALRDAIQRDRARTKVLRMSAFGLIEMTRQRIRPSLKRSVYEDCPHCAGAGVVKTVESMSIDVMRLLALASHREDIRRVNVSVAPPVATYLNNRKRSELSRLETEFNMTLLIRPEDDVPAEHLQIDCFDANNAEIRLLPAPPTGHRRPH